MRGPNDASEARCPTTRTRVLPRRTRSPSARPSPPGTREADPPRRPEVPLSVAPALAPPPSRVLPEVDQPTPAKGVAFPRWSRQGSPTPPPARRSRCGPKDAPVQARRPAEAIPNNPSPGADSRRLRFRQTSQTTTPQVARLGKHPRARRQARREAKPTHQGTRPTKHGVLPKPDQTTQRHARRSRRDLKDAPVQALALPEADRKWSARRGPAPPTVLVGKPGHNAARRSRCAKGRARPGPRVARRRLPPPTVLVGKEDCNAARRSLDERVGTGWGVVASNQL